MTEYIVQINGETIERKGGRYQSLIEAIDLFTADHDEPIEFIWIHEKEHIKTDKEIIFELQMENEAAKEQIQNLTLLLTEARNKNILVIEKDDDPAERLFEQKKNERNSELRRENSS